MSREEKPKRTGRYGYLQDYAVTPDGQAVYKGYYYTARLEAAAHRKKLNIAVCAALLAAVLFVIPGFLPLRGLLSERYVLLLYAITVAVAVRVAFAALRLRTLKEPIKVFEFERTYTVMCQWSFVAALPAAGTMVTAVSWMTRRGAFPLSILTCVLLLLGLGCELFLWRWTKGIEYRETRAGGTSD